MTKVSFSKKAGRKIKAILKGSIYSVPIVYEGETLYWNITDVRKRYFTFGSETPDTSGLLAAYIKYLKEELGARVRIEYNVRAADL